MSRRGLSSCLRALAAAVLLPVVPGALAAESPRFPERPMRMLVGFAPGSLTDLLARTVGQKMTEQWGQPVVIDNRPSGGGVVASQSMLAANPDGHTLLMVSAQHAASASLFTKLPYDTLRDFSGVSQVVTGAHVLVAANALGVKSVRDLIALLKAKPGVINYGSAGVGSGAHINGEMFNLEAGVKAPYVPYKGPVEALNDVAGGRIGFAWLSLGVAAPFIRDGRVVALGVSTPARSPVYPSIPTVAEGGLPGHEFDQWFGLLAASRVPRPVVEKLSAEVARILALPDVRERIVALGAEPKASRPDAFDRFLRAQVETLGKVIRAAGIRVD
ncbi:MAG: tripartite tricarboxylate transporter substrate binding protein [Pseudomonadota bacterium]|jgi:tripartite-type tricarboxylate transporter receptor subunit TctC